MKTPDDLLDELCYLIKSKMDFTEIKEYGKI